MSSSKKNRLRAARVDTDSGPALPLPMAAELLGTSPTRLRGLIRRRRVLFPPESLPAPDGEQLLTPPAVLMAATLLGSPLAAALVEMAWQQYVLFRTQELTLRRARKGHHAALTLLDWAL